MITRSLFVAATALALAACSSGGPTKSATPPTTSVASPPAMSSTTSTVAGPAPTCAPGAAPPADGGAKEVAPPGDIPDNQAFVAYSPQDGSYTVKVPEGWARTDSPRTATFTDKFNALRVDLVDAPQGPTPESAQADEVARLAQTVPCFVAGRVTRVERRGGTAVLITYQADGSADPVTGKVVRDDVERYEFWRNGTEAILTVSGAAGSDNVDPWKLITDSFSWR